MYKKVVEFTKKTGFEVPNKAKALDRKAVEFIVGNMISECTELLQVVARPEEDVLDTVRGLVGLRFNPDIPATHSVVNQADALADAVYYTYNTAAKHGIDLDAILEAVHAANMRKINPDGTVTRDATGHIKKPAGWYGPEDEIKEILEREN
jgi:predicted HAD superfamily Cof-like phosphohydrolase